MARICFVLKNTFFKSKGGAELQAFLIAKHLSKRGHDVHYVYESHEEKSHFSNGIKWHPIKPMKYRFMSIFSAYRRLKDVLDDIRPDIIYERVRNEYTYMVYRYCKRRDVKFVWAVSSDRNFHRRFYHPDIEFASIIKKILDALTFRMSGTAIKNADLVISQTDYQKRKLKENFGKDSYVIHNSLEVPDPPFNKSTPPLILWVGKMTPIKRPELFIDLARRFKDSDIRFMMLGRSPNSNFAKKIEKKIDDQDNIEYPGEVPYSKVNEYLKRATLLVNTSTKFEGFPNTYIQSWMRGTPVIAMKFDPDDIIKKNKIGEVTHNLEDTEEKIISILKNEKKYDEISKKARIYSVKNHDILENVKSIEGYFQDLMKID